MAREITDLRIDLRRSPAATIARVAATFKVAGTLAATAEALGVPSRTLDRAIHDIPALADAIQAVREGRAVART